MTECDSERIVRDALEAFNSRDFGAYARYMAEDLVETYPQSGEQLVGRDQQRAMHEAFPGPPTFSIRTINADGALVVVELDEASSDGSVWQSVFIFELRDGLVASLTGYFCEPFPAPDLRAPFRVRP